MRASYLIKSTLKHYNHRNFSLTNMSETSGTSPTTESRKPAGNETGARTTADTGGDGI